MKKNILFLLLLIILLHFQGNAQYGSTLQFMRLNPYINYSNPAIAIPFNGYLAFPAVSNIEISVYNSSIHYNDLFELDETGAPQTITLDKFIGKLNENANWLNSDLNLEVLGFGFRTKKAFISFGYRLRMSENLSFTKDLIAILPQGNLNYFGEDNPANLDLSLNLNAYQEIALGIQSDINEHWSIGIRPKLLFGIANIRSNNINAKIYTSEDDYSIRVNYALDADIMTSLPLTFNELNPTLNFSNFKIGSVFQNPGLAIDLGVVYKINKKWGIETAVTDLGFISWQSNGTHFSNLNSEVNITENEDFTFDGLSYDEIEQLSNSSEYREQFIDTILDYFPIYSQPLSKYTSTLYTRFVVDGYYNLGKSHRFTALFQGFVFNKTIIPSFTLAYSGTFGRVLDLCIHYTIKPNSYTNLGLGVGLNLGFLNIYVTTNNILAISNPLNFSDINTQLGIVFNWGKGTKKEKTKKKIETIENGEESKKVEESTSGQQ